MPRTPTEQRNKNAGLCQACDRQNAARLVSYPFHEPPSLPASLPPRAPELMRPPLASPVLRCSRSDLDACFPHDAPIYPNILTFTSNRTDKGSSTE